MLTVFPTAFGKDALQQYAEMLDEEETALLFTTVSTHNLNI